MSQRKSLASTLQEQEEEAIAVIEAPIVKAKPKRAAAKPKTAAKKEERPDRTNKVPVTGWFPQRVKLELEEIKIQKSRELGRNVKLHEIMAEAYNDLFKKYDRAELAPVESE
jgi:hypothetical protein